MRRGGANASLLECRPEGEENNEMGSYDSPVSNHLSNAFLALLYTIREETSLTAPEQVTLCSAFHKLFDSVPRSRIPFDGYV